MTRDELAWDHREGRYSEEAGERQRFSAWLLIHCSGRVLASVQCPLGEEWFYRIVFYMDQSFDRDDFRFIDADSAKRFAEDSVISFHEKAARVAAPNKKKAKSPVSE